MLLLSLATATGAALCYGLGSVLQADAARRTRAAQGLDPRLLARLLGSGRYLVGVGLDGAGFLLSLLAVRTLPLFVVQSVVASFLAVTAIAGALWLRMPLTGRDRAGIAVVIGGLVLLGLSAAPDHAVAVALPGQGAVLVAALVLVPLALAAGRLDGPRGSLALGAVAGLAYGITAIAARILPGPGVPLHLGRYVIELAASPALYGLAVAGGLAMLTYSMALQRGSVTQATAPLVVGETLMPAIIGVLWLGDRARPGWEAAAILGCLIAVAGAASLARHGEIETPAAPAPAAPAPRSTP